MILVNGVTESKVMHSVNNFRGYKLLLLAYGVT